MTPRWLRRTSVVIAMTISLFWFAGRPPAARGTMTVTYGASTIHDHSDSVGTIVVTLDPDPIQNAGEFFLRGDPSAAFQTAMTDSLAALDWKNDLTFTYDGSLGGTLTIDVYNAKMKTATAGGAQLLTHYNRAASDPAASSLFWIQVVDTTAPNGGETAPYPDVYFSGYGAGAKLPFYYRPDELNLDANPYVGSEPIRSGNYTVNGQNYNYDLAFWDWPSRSWVNTWHAELFLASYDATTKAVKVYDGIYWGFTIVPEPSSLAMLTVGIAGLALARFTRRAA